MRLSRARFEVLLLDWPDLELSIATINHCLHEAGLLLGLWVICSAEFWLCLIGHRTAEKLEHGFLRVRCDTCHAEHRVAFSCCKKRGFCPSCGARRMAESGALRVDEVSPEQPVRQWGEVRALVQGSNAARRTAEQGVRTGTWRQGRLLPSAG